MCRCCGRTEKNPAQNAPEQMHTADRSPGDSHQSRKEIEFDGSQIDGHPGAAHGASPAVELDGSDGDRAADWTRRSRSSQDCADARDQFSGIEWLRQVIIRAHLEPVDAVVRVPAGSQHQNRGAGVLPDVAQDIEPVPAGHHHVEHDQGVVFGEGVFDACLAAEGPGNLKSFACQEARYEVTECGIVVNNQNAFHRNGRSFYSKTCCGPRPSRCVKGLAVLDESWHFRTTQGDRAPYSRFMTRTLTLAALLFLSMDHAHCEEVTKAQAFEVASIIPCKPGTPARAGEHAGMAQFTLPGGRFRANATTVTFLLEWAYGIQPSQHSDGPSWMGTDRYDIVAKAEGNATDAQMKAMMRTLLAERFMLKVHHESKELPVYVISTGKTPPRLFPATDGEVHGIRIAPQDGPDQKALSYHIVATGFSLAQLTDVFSRQLGRVIVDRTGLGGDFDFTLDLTPDESAPNPLDPAHIMNAIRGLGLTLKSGKARVEFFTVDSVEKVAAGN